MLRRFLVGVGILVVALIVIVLLVSLGMVAYARLGPTAIQFDVGHQAALLLLVTVSVATLAGAGGALIASIVSARSAAEIERQKQDGARKSRLADQTLAVAVSFVDELETRQQELEDQIAARQSLAASPTPVRDPLLPTLKPTDSLRGKATSLYLIAQQGTADRAVDAYALIVNATATYAYKAKRHLSKDGRVIGLTDDDKDRFDAAMVALTGIKTAFMQAIRVELDLPPLV